MSLSFQVSSAAHSVLLTSDVFVYLQSVSFVKAASRIFTPFLLIHPLACTSDEYVHNQSDNLLHEISNVTSCSLLSVLNMSSFRGLYKRIGRMNIAFFPLLYTTLTTFPSQSLQAVTFQARIHTFADLSILK